MAVTLLSPVVLKMYFSLAIPFSTLTSMDLPSTLNVTTPELTTPPYWFETCAVISTGLNESAASKIMLVLTLFKIVKALMHATCE